jgi:hypothetical protein
MRTSSSRRSSGGRGFLTSPCDVVGVCTIKMSLLFDWLHVSGINMTLLFWALNKIFSNLRTSFHLSSENEKQQIAGCLSAKVFAHLPMNWYDHDFTFVVSEKTFK